MQMRLNATILSSSVRMIKPGVLRISCPSALYSMYLWMNIKGMQVQGSGKSLAVKVGIGGSARGWSDSPSRSSGLLVGNKMRRKGDAKSPKVRASGKPAINLRIARRGSEGSPSVLCFLSLMLSTPSAQRSAQTHYRLQGISGIPFYLSISE